MVQWMPWQDAVRVRSLTEKGNGNSPSEARTVLPIPDILHSGTRLWGKGFGKNQVKMKRDSKEKNGSRQRSTVRARIAGGVWLFNSKHQLSDQVQ